MATQGALVIVLREVAQSAVFFLVFQVTLFLLLRLQWHGVMVVHFLRVHGEALEMSYFAVLHPKCVFLCAYSLRTEKWAPVLFLMVTLVFKK